jgi:hypothetical protein
MRHSNRFDRVHDVGAAVVYFELFCLVSVGCFLSLELKANLLAGALVY